MKIDETAQLVRERWKKGDVALRDARRNFWLNLAFYQGKQWVTWDATNNVVQEIQPRRRENERVRVMINKIEPRIDMLMGVLTERPLSFEGDPSDADDASLAGSRLAESVLESARINQGWEGIRKETLLNLLFGGTAAVAVEWNGSGGERLWVHDGDGKVIGTGEVSLVPLSIAEFTIEPGSRRWENARWWIGATAVPPSQAKERYNLDFDPTPDAKSQIGAVVSAYSDRRQNDLVTIYVMYERPFGKSKGRQVCVINEKTVVDKPWPFPFDKLNIRGFYQGQIPMQWYGKTFVSAARPVQVLYNAARSNIAEHSKLASNLRLLVPSGSLDDVDSLTDEAGEVVEYYPNEFGEPHYIVPPGVSRTIVDEVVRLDEELDDILHAHDVARGVAPGDRNSGLALSILAEKNNTPLGVMAHDQADGWGHIGSMCLKLYSKNVTESREAIVISKTGIPQKWSWNGDDLHGQTDVRVPIDSTAPHTRAQMLAQLQNVQQLSPQVFATIPQDRILRILNLSSLRELNNGLDPDVAKAQRENDRMSLGEAPMPADFDDHAKHIAELNAFRKTSAFEVLPDKIKQIFELHAQAHQRMVEEELRHQSSLNAVRPGLATMPQAHDPMGSAVPQPFAQQLREDQPLPSGPPQ